jgi:hypothetical protein
MRIPGNGIRLALHCASRAANARLNVSDKENDLNNNATGVFLRKAVRSVVWAPLVALMAISLSGAAFAQSTGKKDVVTFNLVPVPQFADCLRASANQEPTARATIVRGAQNDALILDLDGVKPNLTLTVFSNERSYFGSDGTKDPNFKGFGLSWYQSDVLTGKNTDKGHVQLQTILLDQNFGFDPGVNLPPTNTSHLGLWFDSPFDAVACGFDLANVGKFNADHFSGPLAFGTLPDPDTGLGPLCTNPNILTKSCGPTPVPAAKP